MFSGFTAKDVATSDSIIKQSIENIVKKEERIINDYKNLKEFRKVANPTFIIDLDKLLEERKIYLTFKMQSKQDQSNALLKLLEYINTLEEKDKEIQNNIILNKINTLESEIESYKLILFNE